MRGSAGGLTQSGGPWRTLPSGSGPRAAHSRANSPSTCSRSCSALVDLIPAVPSSKRVDIGSGIYHADRQGDGDRAAPGDSHCRGGSGAEGSAVVIRHPERAGGVVRLALRPRRCGVHHRLPARQQLLVGSHGLVVLPPSLGAFGRPLLLRGRRSAPAKRRRSGSIGEAGDDRQPIGPDSGANGQRTSIKPRLLHGGLIITDVKSAFQ